MDLLEMLKKKREMLARVLEMTETTIFTDDPSNADQETERYIALYEDRDQLIAELTGLQESMVSQPGYQEFKSSASGEAAGLFDECDTLLRRIIELDKRNQVIAKTMLESVKKNIKRINQGRSVSLKYNNELNATDGYILDAKN